MVQGTSSLVVASLATKQEDAAEKEIKKDYDKTIIDKVVRLGYSHLKLAAELKEEKGPAYETYKRLIEEQKKGVEKVE